MSARRAAPPGVVRALASVALAVVVLGVVLLGGRIEVGYADARASVGPLGATPQPVAPGGEVLVRGTHCVGTGGQLGVVTVSLVQGTAMGGGFEAALYTDLLSRPVPGG